MPCATDRPGCSRAGRQLDGQFVCHTHDPANVWVRFTSDFTLHGGETFRAGQELVFEASNATWLIQKRVAVIARSTTPARPATE
jgi:hypothetical protein